MAYIFMHFLVWQCAGIVPDAGGQSFCTMPTERWKAVKCNVFSLFCREVHFNTYQCFFKPIYPFWAGRILEWAGTF